MRLNNAQRANYLDQIVRTYQGNPLIEALPDILTPPQTIKLTRNEIDYHEEDRFQANQYRLHYLREIINWYQPLNNTIDLEARVSATIRLGLVARNPFNKSYWEMLETERQNLGDNTPTIPQNTQQIASSFAITGDSGTGKTRTVHSVLKTYPQVIVHSKYKGVNFNFIQLTYLHVQCPHDGGMKGLCHNILRGADGVLGTNYYRDYAKNGRASISELIGHLYTVASLHGIGLLIIDEIQNLREAKDADANRMLNFFVRLVNELSIPVVLVGTPRAVSILRSAFRQARRMSGQGDMHFQRMKPDPEWELFVKQMWKYQYVQNVVSLTPEIKEALYYESQGIHDLVIKVFILAQARAIMTGQEILTPAIIYSVRDELRLLQPFLHVLRKGENPNQTYDDLSDFIDIDELVRTASYSIADIVTVTNTSKVTDTNGTDDTHEGNDRKVGNILTESVQRNTSNKTRHKKQQKKVVKSGSMIAAYKLGQKQERSAYDSLVEAGFIRPLNEFL